MQPKKNLFLKFHVEALGFFRKLADRVNKFNATFFFLLGSVLFSLVSKLPLDSPYVLDLFIENQKFFITQIATASLWTLAILSAYSFSFVFISWLVFKIKHEVSRFLYFLGFNCIVISLLSILYSIISILLNPMDVSFLGYPIILFTIYIIYISFDAFIKVKTFLINVIFTQTATTMMVILIYGFFTSPSITGEHYIKYEINNYSNYYTINYENGYNDEVCSVDLPYDWKILNEKDSNNFANRNNIGYEYLKDYQIILKQSLNEDEFLAFSEIPPMKKVDSYELREKYANIENTSVTDSRLLNLTTSDKEEVTVLDISYIYNNSLRHNISVATQKNCLGYEAIYQGSSEGLGSIVKNVKCHYKGGDPYSEDLGFNNDGSFTVNYSYRDKEGKYSCSIKFPKNWEVATPPFKINGFEIKNRTCSAALALFYKKPLEGNKIEEYLKFSNLPPIIYGHSVKDYCKYKESEIEFDRENYRFEDRTYIRGSNGDMCIRKFSDEKKETVRYDVLYGRIFDEIGYTLNYETNYGQDQDLYYILNNSKCYKYY